MRMACLLKLLLGPKSPSESLDGVDVPPEVATGVEVPRGH